MNNKGIIKCYHNITYKLIAFVVNKSLWLIKVLLTYGIQVKVNGLIMTQWLIPKKLYFSLTFFENRKKKLFHIFYFVYKMSDSLGRLSHIVVNANFELKLNNCINAIHQTLYIVVDGRFSYVNEYAKLEMFIFKLFHTCWLYFGYMVSRCRKIRPFCDKYSNIMSITLWNISTGM